MNALSNQTLTLMLSAATRLQWAQVNGLIAMSCAGCPAGRVLLHLLCACNDHQFKWHLDGIVRELARQVLAN